MICGLKHNRLIRVRVHNAKVPGNPHAAEVDNHYALLPMQRLNVRTATGDGSPLVFWDSGSNVNMVTQEYARKAGWQGTPTPQLLQSTNHQSEVWNTVSYLITLVDTEGS